MLVPFFSKGEKLHQDYKEKGSLDAAFAAIESNKLIPTLASIFQRARDAQEDKRSRIDMEALLEIEVGFPVTSALSGDGHVRAGVLPAGQYASLVYTNVDQGIEANYALLQWGAAKGLVWDKWETEKGDAFGSRFEAFLTNPDEEPDRTKWETEVAIRLAS